MFTNVIEDVRFARNLRFILMFNLTFVITKSLKWNSRLRVWIPFPRLQEREKKNIYINWRGQESSNEIEMSALILVTVLGTPNTIYFPITSDMKHTWNRSDAHVWRGTSLSLFSLHRSNGGMKITFSFFDKITIRILCFNCGRPTVRDENNHLSLAVSDVNPSSLPLTHSWWCSLKFFNSTPAANDIRGKGDV